MDIMTIILIAFIVFQNIMHFFERRDLYKRIMCRNINDYKNADKKESTSVISAHKRVLDNWRKRG